MTYQVAESQEKAIDLGGAALGGGEHRPPPPTLPADPVGDFRRAMAEHDLEPDHIDACGKLTRFDVERRGDKAGWYVFHLDGLAAGAFGNWKTGEKFNWCSVEQSQMTEKQAAEYRRMVENARRQREEEEAKRHQEARDKAASMWPDLAPAPADHPYLKRKGIACHGARLIGGNLAIPFWGIDGTLHGFEFIGPAGDKWRLTGTDPKGHFFVIGDPAGPELLFVEGFATGASVHQSTGKPVIVAFNAGNLLRVAKVWREKRPDAKFLFCGDNDKSGTGQTKAREAASAVGGRVVLPPTTGDDFNDLHQAEGLEAVKRLIEGAEVKLSPRDKLQALTVNKEYVAMIGKEEWVFQYLIIKNQIVVIVAKSGGGKTTISFFFLMPWIIENTDMTVFYFDCDSPASDHARMLEKVEEVGPRLQWVNPLTHGKGPEALIDILKEFVESGERLDDCIFFLDTLKKFISMLDKKSVKPFFCLMRQLTALGATVVLLGHANKHRDTAGNLVFEGVGDVMSDTDALIFFERITAPDGGIDITTVVDPDKGAKVRGLYEPISFHLAADRTVTLCKDAVPVPDWKPGSAKKDKLTEEEIRDRIREYLMEQAGPVNQTNILDALMGEPGTSFHRVRNVLTVCAVPQSEATKPGQIYRVDEGLFNRKLYGVVP